MNKIPSARALQAARKAADTLAGEPVVADPPKPATTPGYTVRDAEPEPDAKSKTPNAAAVLLELAASADLFHTLDRTAFADIETNGHRETWPVRGKPFKQWLAHRFYQRAHGAPNADALQAALGVLEARAHFDGPQRDVFVRTATVGSACYLDLADDGWRAVEIDVTGWRIVERPPVRFRRAPGMKPLPEPARDGSIDDLRPFLNTKTEGDFVLAVAWLLAALRDAGPFPVLALAGEQGSAKSTFAGFLRGLVDPNCAPLRALPRDERDLFIGASNAHVLCYDNVSGLPAWLSDALCRLSTGGGFSTRALYSDGDEAIFGATRPTILTGIEDFVSRPDLADRAIFLTLEPIAEERRRPEQELMAEFEAARPRILGALLTAVAEGVAELPTTRLDRLPRLADFAKWATASTAALWGAGTFMTAYDRNRADVVTSALDADPVGVAVLALMAEQSEWSGSAQELLGELGQRAGERTTRGRDWPSTARALSGRVRRLATFLRKVGISIGATRSGRARTIRIVRAAQPESRGDLPSQPSQPSSERKHPYSPNSLADPGVVTVGNGLPSPSSPFASPPSPTVTTTVTRNPLGNLTDDANDGCDAKIPPFSSGPDAGDLDGPEAPL